MHNPLNVKPVFKVGYLSVFVQTVISNRGMMVRHHDRTIYCYLKCTSSTQPFLSVATRCMPLPSAGPHTYD